MASWSQTVHVSPSGLPGLQNHKYAWPCFCLASGSNIGSPSQFPNYVCLVFVDGQICVFFSNHSFAFGCMALVNIYSMCVFWDINVNVLVTLWLLVE